VKIPNIRKRTLIKAFPRFENPFQSSLQVSNLSVNLHGEMKITSYAVEKIIKTQSGK